MGNCFSKQESESFNGPGRVLGTAPAQPKTAAVPAKPTTAVGGPPRKLGGSGGGASSGDPGADQEARRRAAEAAEARLKGTKPTGKLGDQLQAQKRQTRTDTLKDLSADEVRRREIDAATEARTHN